MQPMFKRLVVALLTALALGFIFDYIFGTKMTSLSLDVSESAIFATRLLIGFFVGLLGIVTIHPLFQFKMFIVRGLAIGALISLPIALQIDVFFWAVIAVGAMNGMLIDLAATKFAGHGKKLLHPKNG